MKLLNTNLILPVHKQRESLDRHTNRHRSVNNKEPAATLMRATQSKEPQPRPEGRPYAGTTAHSPRNTVLQDYFR